MVPRFFPALCRLKSCVLAAFVILMACTVSMAQDESERRSRNDRPEAVSASESASETESAEHEEAGDLPSRNDWFYQQRAYPLKQIPPAVRLNAWRHFKTMQAAEKEAAQFGNVFSESS